MNPHRLPTSLSPIRFIKPTIQHPSFFTSSSSALQLSNLSMDSVLCDELVESIIQRLPSSSFPSVALVSHRFLALLRSSTTVLSLRPPDTYSAASLLSRFPFLSSLTIAGNFPEEADALLLLIAASPSSCRLSTLRFLSSAVSVSPSALLTSSSSFSRLVNLHLPSPYPLSFRWLSAFPSLKSLTLFRCRSKVEQQLNHEHEEDNDDYYQVLPLEYLSIYRIGATDRGAAWLWRRCGNLRRLQLRACEGTGDGPSSPVFPLCLVGIQELELRTCRVIADRVLLLAADHCRSLSSLLIYDGGNRDALQQFIVRRGACLRTLDLRLPLDLDNSHISAIAAASDRPGLTVLRLQSCCLVTGDSLRALARAPAGSDIEELALVNCDVVDREPGLLTALAQSMKGLRWLDLSHNEAMVDKAVGAMLESCQNLVDIRLQGCRGLTDATLRSLLKCCSKQLEAVDISRCPGISTAGIELLVLNTPQLDRIVVEGNKISEATAATVSRRGIKLG